MRLPLRLLLVFIGLGFLFAEPSVEMDKKDYALRLFQNQRYLEAAFLWGELIQTEENGSTLAELYLLQGKAFEKELMHAAAREVYQLGLEKTVNQKPQFYFQLMNIAYKEGDFAHALALYQKILKYKPTTEILYDAHYIAGQVYFEKSALQKSIEVQRKIPESNKNYLYGQFTVGISSVRLGLVNEATEAFAKILAAKPKNKSELEIQQAAMVKKAHVLYDQKEPDLPRAAQLYYGVDPNSAYYEEAMIGLAWCFLRVKKPEGALKIAKWLVKNKDASYFKAEALQIEGYSFYLMGKQTETAAKNVHGASPVGSQINPQEVAERKKRFQKAMGEFAHLQKNILEVVNHPVENAAGKKEVLLEKAWPLIGEIRDYQEFLQAFLLNQRFAKPRE